VFYEKNGLLLRASDNFTGRTMQSLSAGLPVYSAPYHQIDLNGDYEFNKHLVVTASVINLSKSTPHEYLGSDTTARLVSLEYAGRQYYVGITYKFGDGG
jgi:outer membrane receptor protein involved in Fe transport